MTSESQPSTSTTTSTTTTVTSSVPTLPKPYGKVILTLDNVLIPKEKLEKTPSFEDGLTPDDETSWRIMGCELICTAGILLKLPQIAMATGQVLFQRFYYSKSLVRQPMECTAMACIYLASKIEEAPRRIRDVVNVFHHMKQVRGGKPITPLILDQSYIRLKSDVTLAERRILKELGFCVHVKHPHKLIVTYIRMLGYDHDNRFVQMAWNYMNDALRSNLFVRYTPEQMACACMYLSARVLKIHLRTSPPWFSLFDVEESDMIDISETILALYALPKIDYEELEKKMEALVKVYQEKRRRIKAGISSVPASETENTPDSKSKASPDVATAVTLQSNEKKRNDSEDKKPEDKENSSVKKKKDEKERDREDSGTRSEPVPTKKVEKMEIDYSDYSGKRKKKKSYRYSRSRSRSSSLSKESKKHSRYGREEAKRTSSPSGSRKHHRQHHHHHKKSKSRHYREFMD